MGRPQHQYPSYYLRYISRPLHYINGIFALLTRLDSIKTTLYRRVRYRATNYSTGESVNEFVDPSRTFLFLFFRSGFRLTEPARYSSRDHVYLWTDKKRIILRGRAAAYYVINYRSAIEAGN